MAKVPFKHAIAASVDDYKRLQRWGLQNYYVRDEIATK